MVTSESFEREPDSWLPVDLGKVDFYQVPDYPLAINQKQEGGGGIFAYLLAVIIFNVP